MPEQPLIAEDRLRQFRDDDTVCASPFERAMAAELLENRAALAAASAAILFASEQVAQANVGHASIRARIAELETEADRLRERRRTWLLRYRTARDRITELEQQAGQSLGYLPIMEWHDGWAIRGPVTDRAIAEDITARDAAAAPEFRHVVAELREVSDRG